MQVVRGGATAFGAKKLSLFTKEIAQIPFMNACKSVELK
jgi:hypothetical protein